MRLKVVTRLSLLANGRRNGLFERPSFRRVEGDRGKAHDWGGHPILRAIFLAGSAGLPLKFSQCYERISNARLRNIPTQMSV